MTTSIKESLTTLAALQRIDAKRDSIEEYLSGVDAKIASLSEQLVTFEGQVSDGLRQLEEIKKRYRQDESDLKSIETAIVKSEQKLHGVKTNKEYQSTLKEIEDFKLKASTTEDQMLTALDSIEEAEKQVAILKDDLVDMQSEIKVQQATIREQAEAQRSTLEELIQQREGVWATLGEKMQKTYERARHQGHGIAVAAIVDGVCQVCRINLPPQAYIELMRMNSLQMCPACQRLMYPAALIEDI
jgi:predicted  nucleic acid-binding Zn-ribbon protein